MKTRPLVETLRALAHRVALSLAASGASGCADAVSPSDGAVADARDAAEEGTCAPTVNVLGPCGADLTWRCGAPAELAASTEVRAFSNDFCAAHCPPATTPDPYLSCATPGPDGGPITLRCGYCASGRRTEGLREPAQRASREPLGAFLAHSATLERASVTAFERIYDALVAHGAPAALVEQALRARDDEAQHAVLVSHAARARGVSPEEPVFEPVSPPSLDGLARENAVEGCARELYGALIAVWQASHARDASLAALYERIAEDESRHAALSLELDTWLTTRLDEAQRARVADDRRAAFTALEREANVEVDETLVRDAGHPDRRAKQALLAALRQQLATTAA